MPLPDALPVTSAPCGPPPTIRPGGTRFQKKAPRGAALLAAVTLLLPAAGCLNPKFVNLSTGTLYPLAPGDEPFLLVRVVNDSEATLDVPLIYDDGISGPIVDQNMTIQGLSPELREMGILLHWPVIRLGIGSLDDTAGGALTPSITAVFPDGTSLDFPFGYGSLEAGVDFNEGDTVIFHFIGDPRSQYFIRIDISRVDSTTQQGPFSRADTFFTVRQTLLLNGMYDYLPVTP